MMELVDYSEIHHSRKIRGTEQAECIEDKSLGEILTMDLHKNANGNWEPPLPFKSDDLSLPDNKGHCLRSLLSLNRWLLNESKLRKDYLAFMKKTLDDDHARQVPVDQLSTEKSKVLHLPHFHVYHPRKPDQIRVVFACSATFENESLIKHLLQGPVQLNSMMGVLTRFRKEEVSFSCDIEQMFYSFYANPTDRNFLRFLWSENNDLTKPIVEYRMNVHLFGAALSPGLATLNCAYIKQQKLSERSLDNASGLLLRDF